MGEKLKIEDYVFKWYRKKPFENAYNYSFSLLMVKSTGPKLLDLLFFPQI